MKLSEKPKVWLSIFLLCVMIPLIIIAGAVAYVDPLFHYSAPNTDEFYYRLYNERSQNDGIVKHFEYDALITGTSMTENFRTTEMDEIFGTHSIKVPFSGGSFKEVSDLIDIAAQNNDSLKMVIRSMDMNIFITDKDYMRTDMGEYPKYLYDNNIFNDVNYLFNKDELFVRVIPMIMEKDGDRGIDSFDGYWRWANWYPNGVYGINNVCPQGIERPQKIEIKHLSDDERKMVEENVQQNIIEVTEKYPNVQFYYFITPYSAVWWQAIINEGEFDKQIEAERILIEKCLEKGNIKLYSFNLIPEITTDINNYRDDHHYGPWVNTLILKLMHDNSCVLTKDNYEYYLINEHDYYGNFDYEIMNNQTDYEEDYYAEDVILRYYENKEYNIFE